MAGLSIEVIKEPVIAEEEDDEDESKELSERMTLLSMQSWLNLSRPLMSNAAMLEEEVQKTIGKIESFITSLEAYAKVTGSNRFRRMRLQREGPTAISIEKIFQERISLGMQVMNNINELLRLERLSFPGKSDSPSSFSLRQKGSLNYYEPTLRKAVSRFVRILNARGIEHDFQILESTKESFIEEAHKTDLSTSPEFIEPSFEQTPSPEEAEQKEKEIKNAIEFLTRVVARNNLSLMFRNVPNKDLSPYECCCACDFDQFTVTAKGPTRLSARINSASKMIKLIMREQHKGNSISTEKFALLTDDEIETAIKILCQTENYALKLRKVCEMHTAHLPKFTTVNEKPLYTVKCEALGYSALGSHKKQYMAKKIAAKKLLLQMPNEGDDKQIRHEIHRHLYKKDRKVKFVTTYRESTLN